QVPKQMKQMAIGQAELQAAGEREKKNPGETPAQQAFRAAVLDESAAFLKQMLNEGGPVDLRFDVDREAGKLTFTTSLAGLLGTTLSGDIAALANVKSVVSGLTGPDSAMSVLLQVSLPAKLRQALAPVIEEGVATALKKESDQNKRRVIELAAKAIAPTL